MNNYKDSQLAITNSFFILLAAVFIILAGIKSASSIVVLILLAAFFAIILYPVVAFLQRLKIPRVIAISTVVLCIIALFFTLITTLASSLNDFIRLYPDYAQLLMIKLRELEIIAARFDILFSADEIITLVDPSSLFGIATSMLGHLSGAMSQILLLTMLCVFMLFEVRLIPIKLSKILKNSEQTMPYFHRGLKAVSRYLVIKTGVSIVTGMIIWAFLTYMDVRFAFMWGVCAFALNFIPSIGSILAAIIPIIQTLLLSGFSDALIIMLGYLAVNIVMGNIIDTRLMGKGLGLSTLVVFASLIFWGWLLGPIGMFLSVPLTIVIKIALENNTRGKKIATILGDGSAE